MNIHLLLIIMARIVDTEKIERLKIATMKLVVEHGYGGASAVLIAKEAKVASGYFYLHYKGKYEMVNRLLHDVYQEVINKLYELIDQGSGFNEIIDNLIKYFFTLASKEPIKLKFLYVLTNDYSFKIEEDVKAAIYETIKKIKQIGLNSNDLDPRLSIDDMYLMLVINSIQYINQRFKNNQEHINFSNEDQIHLLYLIHKILK